MQMKTRETNLVP